MICVALCVGIFQVTSVRRRPGTVFPCLSLVWETWPTSTSRKGMNSTTPFQEKDLVIVCVWVQLYKTEQERWGISYHWGHCFCGLQLQPLSHDNNSLGRVDLFSSKLLWRLESIFKTFFASAVSLNVFQLEPIKQLYLFVPQSISPLSMCLVFYTEWFYFTKMITQGYCASFWKNDQMEKRF